MQNLLHRFLVAHGASAFATGVHIVMLSWLAVSVLGLSPTQFGWVQAAGLIPNLFLMLLAGAWADKRNPATLLAGGLCLHACCYLSLAALIYFDALGFYELLLYAVLVGVGNAFCQPVREKLLTEIDAHSMQKRVSLLSVTQFSLQSVGIIVAGASHSVGIIEVVIVQACVAALAVVVTSTLVSSNRRESEARINTWRDIAEGLQLVHQNKALKQLMALIAFNGYMHLGVFIVLLPIIATQIYHFNAAQYGSLQLVFVLGMISAHFRLLYLKTVEYPGQGALFSLLYTAIVGFALAKYPTVAGLYVLIFCWGMIAGNSAGRSRLVLQALVEPKFKGRAISIYQLMLFGAAPFGSLATGYCLDYLSVREILEFMSLSSGVLFALFLLSRSLWSVKQEVVVETN
ncbi:hypothetical protein TDB9533_02251 [Thalassocella blandensis]|nr:hypothetical protein TDB9533_02251 [Thalassocella blandensis]